MCGIFLPPGGLGVWLRGGKVFPSRTAGDVSTVLGQHHSTTRAVVEHVGVLRLVEGCKGLVGPPEYALDDEFFVLFLVHAVVVLADV